MSKLKIEELQGKIAKMEKGLKSGVIPKGNRPDVEAALEATKQQLAAFKASEDPEPKKVEKQDGVDTRTDIYDALLINHNDLTQVGVQALGTKDYDALHGGIVNEIRKEFGDVPKAEEIAETFLNSKLPKGEKTPEKPAAKPAPAAKVAKQPKEKKAATPKAEPRAKENKQGIPKEFVTYNWLRKVPGHEDAKRVMFKEGQVLQLIEVDKEVFIEHRGGTVAIQPGEGLLLVDGYPFTFLTKNGLDRVKPYTETVTEATHEKAMERIKVLEGRNEQLLATAKAGKKAAPPASEPKDDKKPESNPDASKVAEPVKRQSWSREHGNVARLTNSFYEFLKEHNWTGPIRAKDVLKVVYSTTMDKAYFYVQTKHYGVLRDRIEWHKICPQSWKFGEKLAEKDWPKPGTYRLLLSEADIKKAKTTNGEGMYATCMDTYRKFHECSKDGSCNADDRKKISEAWHTCGDLTLKTDKLPKYMTLLHDAVKAEQKQHGGSYLEAMKRVGKKLAD